MFTEDGKKREFLIPHAFFDRVFFKGLGERNRQGGGVGENDTLTVERGYKKFQKI